MASTALRPVLCTFLYPLPQVSHHHVRTLTYTAKRQGIKQSPQKSLRVARKEAVKRDQIPSDLGFLDG